jgi:hypothetical protein
VLDIVRFSTSRLFSLCASYLHLLQLFAWNWLVAKCAIAPPTKLCFHKTLIPLLRQSLFVGPCGRNKRNLIDYFVSLIDSWRLVNYNVTTHPSSRSNHCSQATWCADAPAEKSNAFWLVHFTIYNICISYRYVFTFICVWKKCIIFNDIIWPCMS